MTKGRLGDRVAIVTGGGGNIGSATAALLAREGCKVLVADLDVAMAKQCVEHIRGEGGEATAFEVDLRNEQPIRTMIDAVRDAYGGLHILHNNAAALSLAQARDKGVADMDIDLWDATMEVNVRGPMLTMKHAIPLIKASGGGSIINTVSGAAMLGHMTFTAYGASKAALLALTKYVATQHGGDGIRCNAVQPGFIADASPERLQRHSIDRHLIKRPGWPEDVAEAVLYLASDASSFITGQNIVVDGGASAHGATTKS